jgi:hypothetical protein
LGDYGTRVWKIEIYFSWPATGICFSVAHHKHSSGHGGETMGNRTIVIREKYPAANYECYNK